MLHSCNTCKQGNENWQESLVSQHSEKPVGILTTVRLIFYQLGAGFHWILPTF